MDNINYIINNLKNSIDLLENTRPPKFVIIGGIPGAGKSLLIEKVKLDFSNENFSVIEPDLYRKHFRNAKEVEETVEVTNKIEYEILSYSLLKRKNIIHISSLRAFKYINELIQNQILPLGYEIYLYVIVTNKIDSSISTYERYINDKKDLHLFPRLNKFKYLENANNGFYSAINFFENVNYLKDFCIFRRGKKMSLPVKICNKKSNYIDIVNFEEKNQISKLDFDKIKQRINLIQQQLVLKKEKNEFDKVLKKIIQL